MTVGVFGDSFAEIVTYPNPDRCQGWSELLKTLYQYNIQNFAYGSTSLFWAYQQLINNIDQCDTVIFVPSDRGRLYWPDTSDLCRVSSFYSVKNILDTELNRPASEMTIFKAAEQYYLHLSNNDFDVFVHTQIINAVKKLCNERKKQLILIPAFDINIEHQSVFRCSLFQVLFKELATQFNDQEYRPERYTRANHMSQANNLALAKIVDKLLNNEQISVSLNDFVFQKVSNPELFWSI